MRLKSPICLVLLLVFTRAAMGVVSPFPIATGGAMAAHPAVSGDTVVWFDDRNGNWDIYGKDLTTGLEFPVSTASGDQWSELAIDGDYVVWEDRRDAGGSDIYAHNLATGAETVVADLDTDASAPAVSGSIVVWQDSRNSFPSHNRDVFGFDMLTETEFEICTEATDQRNPVISGDTVVWWDSREAAGWSIYSYDLTTGVESFVHTPPAIDVQPLDIDGDVIVWEDQRNGVLEADIYGYDLASGTEFLICGADGAQRMPVISGNLVAWMDKRSGSWDIYAYDIATGTEMLVSAGPFTDGEPAISGGIVVWEQWAGPDIYGAAIPEPATLSLLALGGLAMLRRKK